jgi:hypothetical protein
MLMISTMKKKANEADYSLQRGYQRYLHPGWGYRRDADENRIVGYQIFDRRAGVLVWPSYNDIHDHALSESEAIKLLNELCKARGVLI